MTTMIEEMRRKVSTSLTVRWNQQELLADGIEERREESSRPLNERMCQQVTVTQHRQTRQVWKKKKFRLDYLVRELWSTYMDVSNGQLQTLPWH